MNTHLLFVYPWGHGQMQKIFSVIKNTTLQPSDIRTKIKLYLFHTGRSQSSTTKQTNIQHYIIYFMLYDIHYMFGSTKNKDKTKCNKHRIMYTKKKEQQTQIHTIRHQFKKIKKVK